MPNDTPPTYEEVLEQDKNRAINQINQEFSRNSLTRQEFISIHIIEILKRVEKQHRKKKME